ncbi:UNKNOWN [Stylonychia lemnae]|uniref:Uncharacterized protein n=1 Tax=Stylonychia lemnae TaxID=5949 RepID=A0A078AL74_STYLE|nr:UNKNOWN [Stylonychia lemnae]|eukprot:CDW83115.1 UNKNOWN [Stylonychia lemnae]
MKSYNISPKIDVKKKNDLRNKKLLKSTTKKRNPDQSPLIIEQTTTSFINQAQDSITPSLQQKEKSSFRQRNQNQKVNYLQILQANISSSRQIEKDSKRQTIAQKQREAIKDLLDIKSYQNYQISSAIGIIDNGVESRNIVNQSNYLPSEKINHNLSNNGSFFLQINLNSIRVKYKY